MIMQYGENIKVYQRIKNNEYGKREKENERSMSILYGLIFLITAILISRVIMINKTAPFGIAFLIAIILLGDNKLSIISALGVELGYVTNMACLENVVMYITIVPTLVLISIILNNYVKEKVERIIIIGVIMIMILFYDILLQNKSFTISFMDMLLQGITIIPVYMILDYGVNSFKRIKTKHLFSNEEIVAMSVIVALIIAGTWNLRIVNISILNILSFASIMVIAYTCGTSIAATSGVAMGIIIGMSTNSIFFYGAMLGLCGLVAGIFKNGGKFIAAIAAFITFCILKLYIGNYGMIEGVQIVLIEGVLATAIFLIIPEKIYELLQNELDIDKKSKKYEDGYVDKVKGVFTDRLNKFSDVLINMSSTLNNLADNDKLDMTVKSSGVIENLANRVCNTCDTCKICWGREMMNTYNSFQELIEGTQNGIVKFPSSLEKKCMRKGALIRNTEDVINKYVINEMWRNRLAEGRELIANQFNNMAKSVDEIMGEFSQDFNEDKECEKSIFAILEKYDIDIEDVFVVEDKNKRLNIQISSSCCNGSNICVKKILPLINQCTPCKMKIKKDGCRINPDTHKCTGFFEEVPKYEIATSVHRLCKDGQTVFGDNYTYGEMANGNYMMMLSDGMGSGPQAGRESKAVVGLVEKFTEAGFGLITAINTVNSIMSLKFAEEEKFSTVDLSSVDLYSGEVEFIKVGAVASFVKSGNTVDIIKSKSLPIGVLDDADIEVHRKKVKNGDLIVMISDGVVDCDEKLGGRVDWILDYMCRNDDKTIEELSKGLVDKAREMGKNRVGDDMTVMISKVKCV